MGHGQIFFDSKYKTDSKYKASLKKQVQFVLDNRFLFKEITGLDDVRDVFEDIFVMGDFIENGVSKFYYRSNFKNLPQENNNPVYQICQEFNSLPKKSPS